MSVYIYTIRNGTILSITNILELFFMTWLLTKIFNLSLNFFWSDFPLIILKFFFQWSQLVILGFCLTEDGAKLLIGKMSIL